MKFITFNSLTVMVSLATIMTSVVHAAPVAEAEAMLIPTKSEPLAKDEPVAVYPPLPIRTCGPPIVDATGKVILKRFVCPGDVEEKREFIEAEAVVAPAVVSRAPTPDCPGGPGRSDLKKRGYECPL